MRGLAGEILEMTKPLTRHQQVLQFRAWGWSLEEIALAMEMPIGVVSIIIRSPLGASVIAELKNAS